VRLSDYCLFLCDGVNHILLSAMRKNVQHQLNFACASACFVPQPQYIVLVSVLTREGCPVHASWTSTQQCYTEVPGDLSSSAYTGDAAFPRHVQFYCSSCAATVNREIQQYMSISIIMILFFCDKQESNRFTQARNKFSIIMILLLY
jgi:hypothetical protein